MLRVRALATTSTPVRSSVIDEAQHYIYIENQYVSSSLAGGGVENRLMELIMVRTLGQPKLII